MTCRKLVGTKSALGGKQRVLISNDDSNNKVRDQHNKLAAILETWYMTKRETIVLILKILQL